MSRNEQNFSEGGISRQFLMMSQEINYFPGNSPLPPGHCHVDFLNPGPADAGHCFRPGFWGDAGYGHKKSGRLWKACRFFVKAGLV